MFCVFCVVVIGIFIPSESYHCPPERTECRSPMFLRIRAMAGRTHLLSRLIGYYALHGVIVLFVADEPVGILYALVLVFETVTLSVWS